MPTLPKGYPTNDLLDEGLAIIHQEFSKVQWDTKVLKRKDTFFIANNFKESVFFIFEHSQKEYITFRRLALRLIHLWNSSKSIFQIQTHLSKVSFSLSWLKAQDKTSIARTKRQRNIGSPCLRPYQFLKDLTSYPLIPMKKEGVVM